MHVHHRAMGHRGWLGILLVSVGEGDGRGWRSEVCRAYDESKNKHQTKLWFAPPSLLPLIMDILRNVLVEFELEIRMALAVRLEFSQDLQEGLLVVGGLLL